MQKIVGFIYVARTRIGNKPVYKIGCSARDKGCERRMIELKSRHKRVYRLIHCFPVWGNNADDLYLVEKNFHQIFDNVVVNLKKELFSLSSADLDALKEIEEF